MCRPTAAYGALFVDAYYSASQALSFVLQSLLSSSLFVHGSLVLTGENLTRPLSMPEIGDVKMFGALHFGA
jgi:hypothetical protein